MAIAGDADIILDFVVPPNVTNVDGNFHIYWHEGYSLGSPTDNFKGFAAQSSLPTPALLNIHLVRSTKVLFMRSATPFC
jgi:hypothetical protein